MNVPKVILITNYRIRSASCDFQYFLPKGQFKKDVRLTPGEGVCGIWTFNCYSSVILLFYPNGGGRGRGSRDPGFSRTSFVNGSNAFA